MPETLAGNFGKKSTFDAQDFSILEALKLKTKDLKTNATLSFVEDRQLGNQILFKTSLLNEIAALNKGLRDEGKPGEIFIERLEGLGTIVGFSEKAGQRPWNENKPMILEEFSFNLQPKPSAA